MTRRKWPLAVSGLCIVAIFGILALPAEPAVTRANYARVRVGMHKSDVNALFGAPEKDWGMLPSKWLGLIMT
jgi:hypothetical protein